MTDLLGARKPALCIDGLQVAYRGDRRAVRGVDLEVREGQCVALVGESGSGKSSVANAVLGLLPVGARATGSIRLDDEEILGRTERDLRRIRGMAIGFVAQDPLRSFDPMLTVATSVEEAWRVHGRRPENGGIAIALEKLGIADAARRIHRRPFEWSGGMLQRAAIAAAAAHRPRLVVADEPTSALDSDRADSVLEALRATGAGILLISHDLDLVARHSDEVAVMYAGRIVERRPAMDVLERPLHPYSAALLAASPRSGQGIPHAIPGEPPAIGAAIAGCPFGPRCAVVGSECSHAEPVLEDGVACWQVRTHVHDH